MAYGLFLLLILTGCATHPGSLCKGRLVPINVPATTAPVRPIDGEAQSQAQERLGR